MFERPVLTQGNTFKTFVIKVSLISGKSANLPIIQIHASEGQKGLLGINFPELLFSLYCEHIWLWKLILNGSPRLALLDYFWKSEGNRNIGTPKIFEWGSF